MLALILILTASILLYFYFKKKYSYWTELGIPGPKAYPFLGTFLAENQISDGKEQEKKFLREYGPVFGTYVGVTPVLNTCDLDHIKQVFSDVDTFQHFGLFQINSKYANDGIFFSNGHKWKESRRVFSAHFTSRKLKSLISHFDVASKNFLKNIEFVMKKDGSSVVDVKKMTKFFAIDMICKYVLALDVDSFQQHQKDSEFAKQAVKVGTVNPIQIFLVNFIPKWMIQMFRMNIFDAEPVDKLGDLIKGLVRGRDPNLRYDDLSEVFLDAIKNNKADVTEQEMIGNCLVSFFAGTDTLSMAVSRVMYYLVENPDLKERLYSEIKKAFPDGQIDYDNLMRLTYLDAFIKESMRLGTGITSFDKVAAKDTVLEKGNLKIKKGTVLLLLTHLNSTNGLYFPDAFKFDPDRFLDKSSANENRIDNTTDVAFGSGNRSCPGMRFALLEMKYLIALVLLNYDLFKPKDFKIEETNIRTVRVSTFDHMPIGFLSRSA